MRPSVPSSLASLVAIIERLRAPGGCPWDRVQTHRSLAPHMLEELYEVLDAVDQQDPALLREELGDLLLQVVMHSVIADDSGEGFDIGDVADGLRAKMIARHPHVFSSSPPGELSAAEVELAWERHKEREQSVGAVGVALSRPESDQPPGADLAGMSGNAMQGAGVVPAESSMGRAHLPSALAGIPADLPALARSLVVQRKLGRYHVPENCLGVDEWAAMAAQHLGACAASGGKGEASGRTVDPEAVVGDLLYAVVGLARAMGQDPESALRRKVQDLVRQWGGAEELADAVGRPRSDYSAEEWGAFLECAVQRGNAPAS